MAGSRNNVVLISKKKKRKKKTQWKGAVKQLNKNGLVSSGLQVCSANASFLTEIWQIINQHILLRSEITQNNEPKQPCLYC